jgi:hypothetical protein
VNVCALKRRIIQHFIAASASHMRVHTFGRRWKTTNIYWEMALVLKFSLLYVHAARWRGVFEKLILDRVKTLLCLR